MNFVFIFKTCLKKKHILYEILLFASKKMNSLLLHATSVERNKLKLQKCNLLRRTEMGHEWTSSLYRTNRLCSSHIRRTSGTAFLPRASAYSPKPRINITFIFRHNGALPSCHEIAFHYKTSSDMKESTQSEVIWMWSKIDLIYPLMGIRYIQKTLFLQYDAAPFPIGFCGIFDTYWKHIELFLSFVQ